VLSVSSVVKFCIYTSNSSFLRRWSFFEGGEEEVGVKLLDIELGLFAGTGPHHGSAFVVDFEHVAFGFLFGKAQHAAEDERDIAHEIHRIVVNDDRPDGIEIRLVFGFDVGCFKCGHGFSGGSEDGGLAGGNGLQAVVDDTPKFFDAGAAHFGKD